MRLFGRCSLLAPPAALSIAGGQGSFGYVVKLLLLQTAGNKTGSLFEELPDVVLPVDWFM